MQRTAAVLVGQQPAESMPERRWVAAIAWALIVVGWGLRILRYTQGRSLWLDEIFLVENVLHRGLIDLLGPLEYRQGAPVLLLWAMRAAVDVLGTSEWALRAVSLAAGVAGVWLMWAVGRRLVGEAAALVALGLFVVLEPAIYYSSEAKQYGPDLAIGLILMAVMLWWRDAAERTSCAWRRWAVMVGVGILAIFGSHPAIFVLGGGVMALGGQWLLARGERPARIGMLALAGGVWAACFVVNYVVFLRPVVVNAGLQDYWSGGFMPLSWKAGPWLMQSYADLFVNYETMWLKMPWIAAAVSVVGAVWLYVRGWRVELTMITGPIVLAVAASAMRGYVFQGRLMHFVVPMCAMLVGAGVVGVWESGRRWHGTHKAAHGKGEAPAEPRVAERCHSREAAHGEGEAPAEPRVAERCHSREAAHGEGEAPAEPSSENSAIRANRLVGRLALPQTGSSGDSPSHSREAAHGEGEAPAEPSSENSAVRANRLVERLALPQTGSSGDSPSHRPARQETRPPKYPARRETRPPERETSAAWRLLCWRDC